MQPVLDDRREDLPDLGRREPEPRRTTRTVSAYLVAGVAYLFLSLIVWWDVWTGHPSTSSVCGCGDASSSIWFTSWPAHAFTHGLNPMFSTAVGYPTGINLIFAAFGVVLAPITWLFGTVASLNVALTLSPVLSGLAMFALVRRWVSWTPAALVAGAFYGFSPYVLSNLSVAHIDFSLVAIPPLVVICLDELLIRQRRSPVLMGVLLGLLVTAQFFVGLEVLVLMATEVVIGVVLLVIYAARRQPDLLRRHVRPAAKGILACALTALVALAAPVAFAFAGPAGFTASIHPGLKLTAYGAPVRDFLSPALPAGDEWQRIVGGYQGPVLSSMAMSVFFGLGLFAVAIAGVLIWRRDRRLWFFGIMFAVSLLMVTWSGPFLENLPLLRNVVPQHFALFGFLCASMMLAVVLENTVSSVDERRLTAPEPPGGDRPAEGLAPPDADPRMDRSRPRSGSWRGPLVASLVAVVALVEPVVYLARTTPMTIQPIVLPTWFRTVAPRVPGHPAVLALPAPFTSTRRSATWTAPDGGVHPFNIGWKQAALTWQALGGQRTSIIGSGGLGAGLHHRAGENQGQNVITEVTFAYTSLPTVTATDMAAVRRSLSEWGVTKVVLPDQPELPAYDQVASVTAMAALIAGATGARPILQADAWVWDNVQREVPATYPSAARYSLCAGTVPDRGVAAVNRAVSCVLAPSAG
jgi:hypothetical protein